MQKLTKEEKRQVVKAYHKDRAIPKPPRHDRPKRQRMHHPDQLKEMGVIVHPNYVLAYHGMSPYGISREHRVRLAAENRQKLRREAKARRSDEAGTPLSPMQETMALRKETKRNRAKWRLRQGKTNRPDVQHLLEERAA